MIALMSLREAAERGYWQCRACSRLGPDVVGEDIGNPHARCALCHHPGGLVWHPPTMTRADTAPKHAPLRHQSPLP